MPVTIGPDGFLCAEDNPGFRFHAGLTDFLVQQKSGDGATLDAAFKQVKKSFAKAQQVEPVQAIYQRIRTRMRDEIANNCAAYAAEVDRLLTRNCGIFAAGVRGSNIRCALIQLVVQCRFGRG